MTDKIILANDSSNTKTTKKRKYIVPLFTWILIFLLAYVLFSSATYTIVTPTVVTSVENPVGDIEEVVHVVFERINGIAVKTGIRDKIVTATATVLEEAEAKSIAESNLYFDEMLSGMDAYHDWYYSMG